MKNYSNCSNVELINRIRELELKDQSKYFNKQPSPEFPKNSFISDKAVQKYLNLLLPKEEYNKVYSELVKYGDKCGQVYPELAREAELFKPIFEKYDASGNEINKIYTTGAWRYFKDEGCLEQISNRQYSEENRNNKYARIVQMVKVYMLNPVGALSPCPLSMTDGAAFLVEFIAKNNPSMLSWSMKNAHRRILTRDTSDFITSGQWMTELLGGSDVRASTETKAIHIKENQYKLFGLKWFTSAIDAAVTFTLAKIIDPETQKIDEFPTLFFLELRKEKGELNNISIVRLKDKLGTKQLPTSEIILSGSVAEIASPRGKGISYIMQLADITRLHNMISSVGFMRGMVSLLEDYSFKRKAFGKLLINQELHYSSLRNLQCCLDGNLLLALYVSKLVGENYVNFVNNNPDHDLENLLRLLLSLGKIYCGKQSETLCLDAIQCFGAIGYMENSGIPFMLRDTMVTSIWEGTFNTLSLEFFKVFSKNNNNSLLKKLILNKRSDLTQLEIGFYSRICEIYDYIIRVNLSKVLYHKKEYCFLVSALIISSLILYHNRYNETLENKYLIMYWINNLEKENLVLMNSLNTYDVLEEEKTKIIAIAKF